MSFITNVNTLAGYLSVLDKAVKLFDADAIQALEQADLALLNSLAQDLEKGTSFGKRKLDIDLVLNAVDPTNEVAYDGIEIHLADGTVVDEALSYSTITNIVTGIPAITASKSYVALRDAVQLIIDTHNAAAAGLADSVINTYMDIEGATIPNAKDRSLRFLDVPQGASNITKIVLKVAAASVADAKEATPTYSWADTTSSLQVLIDHLPEFIQHTNIWQQVSATNPLPTSGQGFLGKTSTGAIQWQAGNFVIDLGLIDITKSLADNAIDANIDVRIGAFGLVSVGGTAHAEFSITEPVSIGSIVFVDSSNQFRVLDDAFHSRVLLGTDTHPDPQQGMLAYDTNQQRLAIALPTNVVGKYAWVDASPALSAGDLSAILAPDNAITVGALNTQAATPKQINAYVTGYAGKKADLDAATTAIGVLQTDMASIPSAGNLLTMQASVTQAQTDIATNTASKVALAGDVMLGPLLLTLSGTIPSDQEAVTFKFIKDTFLIKPTDVISASALLQFSSDPVNANDAVRRSWVVSEVATATSAMLNLDGTTPMTGALILAGIGEPPQPEAAVSKGWLLSQLAGYITTVGATQSFTGSIDFNDANALNNLGAPQGQKDAANKQFVETTVDQKIRHVADEHTGVIESAKASNADVLFIWDV